MTNETTVLFVTAAAAALGLYVIWRWSTERPRTRRPRAEQNHKTSEELRRARLDYLEKNTMQTAKVSDEEGLPGAEQEQQGSSTDPPPPAACGERQTEGRKAELAALLVTQARAMPAPAAKAHGSRTPTSPARAMFFKRQNSVVAREHNPNSFHSHYLCAPHPPIGDPAFDDDSGAPVSNPLRTADDVMNWCPGFDEFSVAWCALQRRSVVPEGIGAGPEVDGKLRRRARLVACHDMMGGYLQDRLCQGASSPDPSFYVRHWHMIDTLIYFSHHLVTLPPPTWINAAHLHGVPVLGTFITEWEAGADVCSRLLTSVESAHALAEKLAAMAEYYRFDGWLVNIENKISEEAVPVMCEFLQHLTRKVHDVVGGHGCVLWYDSVTKTGSLDWQNALNGMNSQFYHSCDGIFLNYNWTDDGLEQSRQLAGEAEALDRVFVGIDVFGRGCPGGGGYNAIEALESITSHSLSAALFAFGWVWETQDRADFAANSDRFWRLLSPSCVHFCPASLPLRTSFSLGSGDDLYINGKRVRDGRWAHLSAQDVQPNATAVQSSATVTLDTLEQQCSEAFNGGHVMCLRGRTAAAAAAAAESLTSSTPGAECAFAKLLCVQAGVNHPLIVSVSHRVQGPVDVALSLSVNLPSGRGVQLVLPFATDGAATGASSTESEQRQEADVVDSLDEKLRERYGICRSPMLRDSHGWYAEQLIQPSDPPIPLSRTPSITLAMSLNSSLSMEQPGGASPSPFLSLSSDLSASASLSSSMSELMSPLVEGFAELRGANQAKLDSLATGFPVEEWRRAKSPGWKTSHFLIAGQHIRSFHVKHIAVLCRPGKKEEAEENSDVDSGVNENLSSSVDKDDETFDIKIGEIRLAEARWARPEFYEAPFALRCGGVQWQLCPSVVLHAPKLPSGFVQLSISGCTPSYLDMTLLWDHPAPLSISHFDVFVYGLEKHRLCIQTRQPGKSTGAGGAKPTATTTASLPDLHEDATLESVSAEQLFPVFPVALPSPQRRLTGRPEFLGRAYGLSYHISRMPLVCKGGEDSRPSPELLKKTTSLSALSATTSSSSTAAQSPSPSFARRSSQSTPVTPSIDVSQPVFPQQHIWLAVQAVSRAGFRLPLDRSPCVCFSWS